MLDVISGGRIISGFVRGTGMEYFSYNINPTLSRERMDEAHDLMVDTGVVIAGSVDTIIEKLSYYSIRK